MLPDPSKPFSTHAQEESGLPCRRAPGTRPQGDRRPLDHVRHAHACRTMFSATAVSSRCLPCWSGWAPTIWPLGSSQRTCRRPGPAIGPTALLGGGQHGDLRVHARPGHQARIARADRRLRAELPRHPPQQLALPGDVPLHDRAVGAGIANRRHSRRNIPFITFSPASLSGRGFGSGRWPTSASSSPWSSSSAVSWFTGCGSGWGFMRFS